MTANGAPGIAGGMGLGNVPDVETDTDGDINGGRPLGAVRVDNGSTSGTAAMLAAAGSTPREREGAWPMKKCQGNKMMDTQADKHGS